MKTGIREEREGAWGAEEGRHMSSLKQVKETKHTKIMELGNPRTERKCKGIGLLLRVPHQAPRIGNGSLLHSSIGRKRKRS